MSAEALQEVTTMSPAGPVDLNSLSLPDLYKAICAGPLTVRLIELARDEDLGDDGVDITSDATIGEGAESTAKVVSRADGQLAGAAAIPQIIDIFDRRVRWAPALADGSDLYPGAIIGSLRGPLGSVLTIERTLLNLVSRLCGVATLTRTYVRAIEECGATRAQLFDTRKTTPGMRGLEKYAVRCGGGRCHRIGLYDAVLIKDNHLAGASLDELPGLISRAAEAARRLRPGGVRFIEVEVDTLDQFRRILQTPSGTVDIVLLDNMSVPEMTEAASLRANSCPELELEASGGVTLDTIGAIAKSGVDRISVGALTHSAPILDLGLDIGSAS